MSHSKYMMDIYFRIIALEDEINHIPKKYNTIKYLTYALRLLKEYDVVILGHTHKLESHHTYYLESEKTIPEQRSLFIRPVSGYYYGH